MLYPTLNQPLLLFIFFIVGILSGLVFDIARLLTSLSGGDKWSRHIFDFFAVVVSFAVLFFANLSFNLGQFRIYIFVVYLLSFALQRFISKILWTKLLSKWYTTIMKRRNDKIEKGEVG